LHLQQGPCHLQLIISNVIPPEQTETYICPLSYPLLKKSCNFARKRSGNDVSSVNVDLILSPPSPFEGGDTSEDLPSEASVRCSAVCEKWSFQHQILQQAKVILPMRGVEVVYRMPPCTPGAPTGPALVLVRTGISVMVLRQKKNRTRVSVF